VLWTEVRSVLMLQRNGQENHARRSLAVAPSANSRNGPGGNDMSHYRRLLDSSCNARSYSAAKRSAAACSSAVHIVNGSPRSKIASRTSESSALTRMASKSPGGGIFEHRASFDIEVSFQPREPPVHGATHLPSLRSFVAPLRTGEPE